MVLQAIKYQRGRLEILDQLKLPHQEVYVRITSAEEAWSAIKSMQVRGAPAIAIVAILSLAVWGATYDPYSPALAEKAPQFLSDKLKYLVTSRPTAVNLAEAASRLDALIWTTWSQSDKSSSAGFAVIERYIKSAEQMLVDDVKDNENIGKYGAEWISRQAKTVETERFSVLTHCNTGSLATAGYGTALGVIRSLYSGGSLVRAYYTETRPYNQGSRLTGYELLHDNIPATLITDSMAGALLRSKHGPERIVAIVVGADRVVANGDTANKIGTYPLAILARYHNVKFVVAAPRTTIDLNTKTGTDIVIEERSSTEVTRTKGPPIYHVNDVEVQVAKDRIEEISTAAENTQAWNPAFDVTPAELIDAIVTEVGVAEKNQDGRFDLGALF